MMYRSARSDQSQGVIIEMYCENTEYGVYIAYKFPVVHISHSSQKARGVEKAGGDVTHKFKTVDWV